MKEMRKEIRRNEKRNTTHEEKEAELWEERRKKDKNMITKKHKEESNIVRVIGTNKFM